MPEPVEQTNNPEPIAAPVGDIIGDDGKKMDVQTAINKADGKKPEEVKARPEWLPERFKSPEDLAKSYTELEKTLKEKGKVAPDVYEIDPDIGLDKEDEQLKALADVAKSSNMSNAQVNAVLKFAKDNGFIGDAVSYDDEMAKLGADKDGILGSIGSFAQTKLTSTEQETLHGLVYTAEQAKLIHKMIRMNNSIPVKPGDTVVEGKEDLQKTLNALLSSADIRTNRDKQKEAEAIATRIASIK